MPKEVAPLMSTIMYFTLCLYQMLTSVYWDMSVRMEQLVLTRQVPTSVFA